MKTYRDILSGFAMIPGASMAGGVEATLAAYDRITATYGGTPGLAARRVVDIVKLEVWSGEGDGGALAALADGIARHSAAAAGVVMALRRRRSGGGGGGVRIAHVVSDTARLYLTLACDLILVLDRVAAEQPRPEDIEAAARSYRGDQTCRAVHEQVGDLVPRRRHLRSDQYEKTRMGIHKMIQKHRRRPRDQPGRVSASHESAPDCCGSSRNGGSSSGSTTPSSLTDSASHYSTDRSSHGDASPVAVREAARNEGENSLDSCPEGYFTPVLRQEARSTQSLPAFGSGVPQAEADHVPVASSPREDVRADSGSLHRGGLPPRPGPPFIRQGARTPEEPTRSPPPPPLPPRPSPDSRPPIVPPKPAPLHGLAIQGSGLSRPLAGSVSTPNMRWTRETHADARPPLREGLRHEGRSPPPETTGSTVAPSSRRPAGEEERSERSFQPPGDITRQTYERQGQVSQELQGIWDRRARDGHYQE